MRKAIDWEKGLSTALAKSLENTGSCGASGAKAKISNNDGHFSGTTVSTTVTTEPAVVTAAPLPVTTENQSSFYQVAGSGYQEVQHLQAFPATVTTGTTVTTDIEDKADERAAIIEFDAGIPRTWAEGFARLDRRAPLVGFSETQWQQIVNEGGTFLDAWGAQAASLSWDAADLFGVHPDAPRNRYDQMGLVFLIGGGRVTAIDRHSATIRRGISTLVYRRCSTCGACVWELENAKGAGHDFH
jgi:hypothetical protein